MREVHCSVRERTYGHVDGSYDIISFGHVRLLGDLIYGNHRGANLFSGDFMLDSSELFEAIGGGSKEEPDQDVIERFRFDDSLNVPIELTDLELWANYVNDDLYVMDKKIRQFFKKIRWKQETRGGYRTTAQMMFAWIYGRQPSPSDGYACRMIHELLRYYCTSFTGETTFGGKRVNRVYKFSKYATKNKRPYSLRLRLEEAKDGQDPWRRSPVSNEGKRSHGRRKHSDACEPTDE